MDRLNPIERANESRAAIRKRLDTCEGALVKVIEEILERGEDTAVDQPTREKLKAFLRSH